MLNIKQIKKLNVINAIFIKKYIDRSNFTFYYLNLWQKNSLKMKINQGVNIISKATLRFTKKRLAKRKLKKLFRKNFIKNLLDFSNIIKISRNKSRLLETASARLEKFIKLVEFRKMKKLSNLKEKLTYSIDKCELKSERSKVTRYFKRWKKIKNKIIFKEKVYLII